MPFLSTHLKQLVLLEKLVTQMKPKSRKALLN